MDAEQEVTVLRIRVLIPSAFCVYKHFGHVLLIEHLGFRYNLAKYLDSIGKTRAAAWVVCFRKPDWRYNFTKTIFGKISCASFWTT